MKKSLFVLFISTIMMTSPVYAKTEKEILFRDVPWCTSLTNVKEILTEFDLYGHSGETMDRRPIREIIENDHSDSSKEFPIGGINIIASPFSNYEIQVAGYTTSNVHLYFAFTPDGDILPQDYDHSALYGARYEFEPMDLSTVSNDLKNKLTSLYGNPDDENSRTDFNKVDINCTYWNGANDTQVVMTVFDSTNSPYSFSKDEIWLNYIYLKGDALLHEAEDVLTAQLLREENAISEGNDTNGL